MTFRYQGTIPASKSLLNRLLVIRSFAPELEISGDSQCDDVNFMRRALAGLLVGDQADCGSAGTTFRFLALRASRLPGQHFLKASPQLLMRPQKPLIDILNELGVRAELNDRGLFIESRGWRSPANGLLKVDRSLSSQFASAVLLSAWELDFDLRLHWESQASMPSEGYWEMTVALARAAGMKLEKKETEETGLFQVPRNSRVTARSLAAESDLSSCFAVAALAAIAGPGSEAIFETYPDESSQPDAVFPEILSRLGVDVATGPRRLTVRGTSDLSSVDVSLRDCPDLFPVLAVLCAFARGRSRLFGAPHLAHKESDRIAGVADLLTRLGRKVEVLSDGLVIEGQRPAPADGVPWTFDPADDHRLAMAAAVARLAGSGVQIQHPECVNKSFPEFWRIYNSGQAER